MFIRYSFIIISLETSKDKRAFGISFNKDITNILKANSKKLTFIRNIY
jgi:hypothetical protein